MGKHSNNGPFYFYPWAKGPITNETPNLWANILVIGPFSSIHSPFNLIDYQIHKQSNIN